MGFLRRRGVARVESEGGTGAIGGVNSSALGNGAGVAFGERRRLGFFASGAFDGASSTVAGSTTTVVGASWRLVRRGDLLDEAGNVKPSSVKSAGVGIIVTGGVVGIEGNGVTLVWTVASFVGAEAAIR